MNGPSPTTAATSADPALVLPGKEWETPQLFSINVGSDAEPPEALATAESGTLQLLSADPQR